MFELSIFIWQASEAMLHHLPSCVNATTSLPLTCTCPVTVVCAKVTGKILLAVLKCGYAYRGSLVDRARYAPSLLLFLVILHACKSISSIDCKLLYARYALQRQSLMLEII